MLQIPLNQLKPAKNNVRKVKSSSESLNALAASIESQGLLHNLVIRKNGKGYEVIDGNRRLSNVLHCRSCLTKPKRCFVITNLALALPVH
jgi:ParB-like chromosome segregation protein Spo0J